MRDGPDIARIAALIGDPARANMLTALLDGGALTAKELAAEAAVSASTASGHLAKLHDAALLIEHRQGRHRYFALSGPEVGAALEALMGLAARRGMQRTRPGPRDAALRHARSCYDHLAGEMGVRVYESLCHELGVLDFSQDGSPVLSRDGEDWARSFGVDVDALLRHRRPVCKACLDWSQRRHHLGGSLGAALLSVFEQRRWITRAQGSRVVTFSPRGQRAFSQAFPVGRAGNDRLAHDMTRQPGAHP
ncbi:MAG: helix-turn-helix transcriptional regulator [Pseudomonadota bacterium]